MKRKNGRKLASVLAVAMIITMAGCQEANITPETTGDAVYDQSEEHDAVVLQTGSSLVGGTYIASGEDESAASAGGSVTATVTGARICKTGGDASSNNDASFKGVNAAVRVYDSAEVTLQDCIVEASAKNATGIFAYGDAKAYINDCTVNVTGGGAGGIEVAGGGTIIGSNLTVTTASKAAIRSDRGGGIIELDGGVYTANGTNGCPAIYSTADITVRNAQCISTQSRAVIIEGKNSVTLENCTLTGNDQSSKEGSVRANVLLYQSASGDASVGTSVFTMTGGSITSQSGAMFYCTNTDSIINLNNVGMVLSDDGTLLIVSEGRWGKEGRNGGQCTLNAADQQLEGTIVVDEISQLTIELENSTYTGQINGQGTVKVVLDESSVWTLKGDSYITALEGNTGGVELNGHTLYVNGKAMK